jgi:hypothetical protein
VPVIGEEPRAPRSGERVERGRSERGAQDEEMGEAFEDARATGVARSVTPTDRRGRVLVARTEDPEVSSSSGGLRNH